MKTFQYARKSPRQSHCFIVGALLFAATSTAFAQPVYPDKPIRLIIAFGAGGIADVVSRVYAQKLGEALNQPIIVENKPGAGGNIAAQYFSQAKPDGYTLFIGSVGTQIVNKMLYNKLSYDPDAFVPVSMLTSAPFMMAVNKDTGITSLNDLVSTAKKQPGKLNFGSAGVGTSPHLSIELLKFATKADIAHVPYKSGAEAATAGMGGQVDVVADGIPVINPGGDIWKATASSRPGVYPQPTDSRRTDKR
jgi:tripartite-type tricarboxylate transporter receptor subunit TctC